MKENEGRESYGGRTLQAEEQVNVVKAWALLPSRRIVGSDVRHVSRGQIRRACMRLRSFILQAEE